MYKKCYATRLGNNKYKIHLWDEGGFDEIEWHITAYHECNKKDSTHRGTRGEYLKKQINQGILPINCADKKIYSMFKSM